jgi:hypothetical protein
MYDRARTRVCEILDGPMVDPVPDASLAEVDRILAQADAELHQD